MIIRIDSTTATLDESDAFDSFKVVATSDADLTQVGVAADDGKHVFIAPDTVRALAGPTATSPEWENGLRAMRDYAASKGWLDDGGRVRAHVERA